MIYAVVMFRLARLINSGRIDPISIGRDEFFRTLVELGRTDDDAFEIYVTRVKEEIGLIRHCVSAGEAKSGIVLLFTLFEGEVNTLIRINLGVRGFSSKVITGVLRGSDFDSKIDVLLPLLEVRVPERIRNTAIQCRAIRNLVVHNKATPALSSDEGTKPSDSETVAERADQFFRDNPLDRVSSDIEGFVDAGIASNKDVRSASTLFNKYYPRD